ncbi:MAG: hypothetical protein L0Z62_27170 [Gemmataceae bacterium]|nr:hypothetical protein [Gemmataceae bacterium]
MRSVLFLAVVGGAAGLLLVAPSTSHAQVGFDDCAPGGYYGGLNYSGYSNFYDRGYGRGFGGYGSSFGGYGSSFGGYGGFRNGAYSSGYYGRPVIVHPTHRHWTPFRGVHEHGHIHVPHRGHYHTYRY